MSLTPIELEALALSVRVAGLSVVVSLPAGIVVAWVLARMEFRGKSLVDGLVHLPLVLPPVVVGYLLLRAFGRAGPLGGLLDALGLQRVTLVGNSQGGAIAIRTALDHPGRIASMVLMAPGGLEPRETYMQMRGIRSMLRCIYGPEGITEYGMRKVFEKQLYDSSLVTDELVADRTAVALTQPRHVFETMKVDNQEDRLSELTCPVLGLWGADDLFTPVSGAMKLATRVPNCRVTVFNRCGHWVMVEHADTFNRLCIDFLTHG